MNYSDKVTEINSSAKDFVSKNIDGIACQLSAAKPNSFPTESFPPFFKNVIAETNRALNFPEDYMGTSLLVAASTAIGLSAKIKVKSGWYEYASLFAANVGNPGANKSHPQDFAFKPYEKIDGDAIQQFSLKMNDWNMANALDKKNRMEAIDSGKKPRLKKTILHNFTPEILATRLLDNANGVAIVSDELSPLLDGMSNYSKSDQTENLLSTWSNKATSVDRKSQDVPIFLPRPFVCLLGGIQKRILPAVFNLKRMNNGLFPRFLFACPETSEKQPINDNEISEQLINNYSRWIEDFVAKTRLQLNEETWLQTPKIYHWSEEAKAFFYDWNKKNTNRVNENPNSIFGEVLSKFDNHFVRLSLILQIMENHETDKVGINAVRSAERLCEYYINCSKKVLHIIESSNSEPIIKEQDKLRLYYLLPDTFTAKQAVELGKSIGMISKTVERFYSQSHLFDKVSHGNYSKKTNASIV